MGQIDTYGFSSDTLASTVRQSKGDQVVERVNEITFMLSVFLLLVNEFTE